MNYLIEDMNMFSSDLILSPQVPLRELVSYLTAASALRMSQVVERCTQAVSQYFNPTLAHLKVDRHPEGEETQHPDSARPSTSLLNQAERGMTMPGTSFLDKREGDMGDGEAGGIKSEWRVTQREMVDSQSLGEAREEVEVLRAKLEMSEVKAYSREIRETGAEGGENQQVHISNPSYPLYQLTGAHRRKQRPPTPFRDPRTLSPNRGSPTPQLGVADSSQDRREYEGEGPREEEEVYMLAEGRDSTESRLLRLTGVHLSGTHLSGVERAGDADSLLVQRPYLCRRCDRVFQHLENYVGHLKEHRQYLCLLCGKSFSQKSNLTRHVRVHTGVKPFRCPLCHKTFSQKATLQDHLNLHTGDKPHKCNYCAVHFAHKPGLRRHLKDIHGKSSLQNVFEEIVD